VRPFYFYVTLLTFGETISTLALPKNYIMKRTLLITAMAALSLATKAQNNNPNPKHRVFVSGGLSYAFPAAGQNADSWGNPYSGTQNVTTGNFEFKKASLSSG